MLPLLLLQNGRRHLTSSRNEVSRDLIVTENSKKKQAFLVICSPESFGWLFQSVFLLLVPLPSKPCRAKHICRFSQGIKKILYSRLRIYFWKNVVLIANIVFFTSERTKYVKMMVHVSLGCWTWNAYQAKVVDHTCWVALPWISHSFLSFIGNNNIDLNWL